ncbi:MAG TPA: hypothetical protein VG826_25890 [Pirellulales bacterium]|nr:hypothetical protein [Pirellulales bacterium]
MDENRRRRHAWAFWTAIILIVVFVIYPLSLGPLAWLGKAVGDPPWFEKAMYPLVLPLRLVPTPVRDAILWWIVIWRGPFD